MLRLLAVFIPLLLAACSSAVQERGFVHVQKAVPGIHIKLVYATAENTTGRALYPARMPCLLHQATAARLATAQKILNQQGYGLKVWDAWRPLEAHQALYASGARTGLFLAPAQGWSRHCGGVAVDVTLVDSQGQEVPMPTRFDEGSPHTPSSHTHPDPAVNKNKERLHAAMRQAGFAPLPGEWWHFDDLEFLYAPVRAYTAAELGVRMNTER